MGDSEEGGEEFFMAAAARQGARGDDFWSEENTSVTTGEGKDTNDDDYTHGDFVESEGYLEADIAYGSHGNYSYNCDDEIDEDRRKETENSRSCHRGDDPPSCSNGEDDDDCHHTEGQHIHLMEEEDDLSRLDYSFHSEDEYEEEEEEQQQQIEEEYDYATVVPTHKQKLGPHYQEPSQNSPTDPMEFNQFLHDSVSDGGDYFNQFPVNRRKEREEVFDPFDLYGGDDNESQVTSNSFPKAAMEDNEDVVIITAVKQPTRSAVESLETFAFVCALPNRKYDDEEEDDENELTMGDVINGSLMDNMSLVTDDSTSICTDDGMDSLGLSKSESLASEALSRNSFRKEGGIKLAKVRHMLASVGSSVSSRSGRSNRSSGSSGRSKASASSSSSSSSSSSDTSMEEQFPRKGGEAHATGSDGSVVSHFTDEIVNGNEEIDEMSELDGLDCFESHDNDHQDPSEEGTTHHRGDYPRNDHAAAAADEEEGEDDMMDNDYPEDECSVQTRGVEPEGPNMSTEEDDDEDEALAAAFREDIEIETFLSIASTFSAMANTTTVAKHHRGGGGEDQDGRDLPQSKAVPCSSGDDDDDDERMLSQCSSNKTTEEEEEPMSTTSSLEQEEEDENEYDAIDCFPAEEEPGRAVRFHIDEEYDDELEYDTNVTDALSLSGSGNRCCVFPCLDACIDGVGESIDDTLTSVERFCSVVCCQGPGD